MPRIVEGFMSFGSRLVTESDGATSLDHPDQNDDDGQNQQNVHEAAQGIRGDQPEQPENEQDDGDGPKQIHYVSPSSVSVNAKAGTDLVGRIRTRYGVTSAKLAGWR